MFRHMSTIFRSGSLNLPPATIIIVFLIFRVKYHLSLIFTFMIRHRFTFHIAVPHYSVARKPVGLDIAGSRSVVLKYMPDP
jgi:hypothetical protein